MAVGLSSWFQKDSEEAHRLITTPVDHAAIWEKTLDSIAADGLLDAILFVDLCNEWPVKVWAPFFNRDDTITWADTSSIEWMKSAIVSLRRHYPDLPCTFSYVGCLNLHPRRGIGR